MGFQDTSTAVCLWLWARQVSNHKFLLVNVQGGKKSSVINY